MITITACLIVKNEASVLRRCLDCLTPIADEIVIVDTGSTDNTKEIGRKYTDFVYDFKWVDDFAAARNFSFSKATKDYIYVADADEVIDEENRKKFLKLKEAFIEEIEIVQMYYGNQLEHGTTYNFDKEYRPKLFKRLREFKWKDPLHETVEIKPVIFDSDIVIMHMPLENHSGRDFSMLRRIIDKGEALSDKLVTMYAKELFIAGTKKDLFDAYEYFITVSEDAARSLDTLKDVQCVLAKTSRIKEDYYQFITNCLKGVADDASSEICYEIGEYYYSLEEYREAIIWFYNAAYETQSRLNVHYGGDYPLKRLAECYERLGNEEESRAYQKLASEWKIEQ